MENTNCFNFGGQDSMLEDTAGRNMTANPYDENSKYKKGAICIQNNKLYEASQNIDVAEQFTESHWDETALGDIVAKNKSDISTLIEKMQNEKFIVKDFVSSNTSISGNNEVTIAFPSDFIPDGYKIIGSNISGTGSASCFVRAVTGQGINVHNFSAATATAKIIMICTLSRI